MKHHPTLPTKREPVKKGIIKRLHAVTKNRKQRVAATAMAGDFDTELPGRKIGMALAVIVGVHVIAAGLVFFHHWRLEGRGGDAGAGGASAPAMLTSNAPLPTVSKGDEIHPVSSGENYQTIADKYKVDANELREANNNTPIRPGLLVKIPPKKISAMDSPEVAAMRAESKPDDRGFDVEIKKAIPVPGATLVKPNVPKNSAANFSAVNKTESETHAPKATPVAKTTTTPKDKESAKESSKKESATPKAGSGRSYTVQNGDTLYRIAGRYKISPEQLMKANGISDARKLKPGMTLSVPN